MYTYQKFDELCEDAKNIRVEVFVDEQGFAGEFDSVDGDAVHFVFYDGDKPVATCRYYKEKDGQYHIGRIAVRKECRGKNIGSLMLKVMEEEIGKIGGTTITLGAQQQARPFYEKNGYVAVGEPYFEEHSEHIHMVKDIECQ